MKLIRYFSIVIIAVSLLSTAAMADWPMWGGTPSRNMVGNGMKVSIDFDLQKGKEGNVVWQQSLGSQTYGNPVVADGKVFVGTNNGGGWRKDKYPAEQDKGVVLAFNEEDGEFLWQLTRDKLPIGRVSDWLLQGICSVPVVEDKRMYVVTNRCELMCLDTEGFRDGKNDGEVTDEVDATEADADIIWSLDMIDELGVFPHNLATSSPVVHGDLIYLLTSNGVDEGHLDVPAARSPCFLAVNKNTGEVAWDHNQPFDKILHGQWSSPALGEVNGRMQVFFPGGDGVLYAHDAVTGEEIWRFDLNPKATKWELYGKGTRNSVISTPVFHDNSVILAVGQDPEHGEGVGHLWRIDATKNGDVSPEIGEIGSPGKPNPNSAVIWHYGGEMETEAGEKEPMFRRTMSTVSVYEDMVFAADLSGFVHCIDLAEGTRHWEHDLFDGVWGSTLAVDGKVFLGSEEGSLTIFKASKEKAEVLDKKDTVEFSSIYSTPTFTNGRMYLSDRTRLYAVDVTKPTTAAAPLAAAGATAGTAAGIAAGTHPETAEGGSAGASGGAVTNGEGGHAGGHGHAGAHGHADGHAGAAVAAGTTGAESADGYGNSLMFPILILLLVLVVLGALVMGDDELRAKFDGMFKRK